MPKREFYLGLLIGLLGLEIIWAIFFTHWTFANPILTTSNRFFGGVVAASLAFCMISYWRSYFLKVISVAIVAVLLLVHTVSTLTSFDTTTEPVDVITLRHYPAGEKLVVRQMENGKTHVVLRDTVRVADVGVFRKLL